MVALAAVQILHPAVPVNLFGERAPHQGTLLVPMVAGLVLIALLNDRPRCSRMDERVRRALIGHSMPYELAWLLTLLALFIVVTFAVSGFVEVFLPGVSWEVLMPPVRILFLFVLPLLVVDLGGFTIAGYSTVMPLLAMRVVEGWRWLGLAPAAAVVGLMGLAALDTHPVDPAVVVAAVIAIVAAVAIPEEIFFRALLQTRLERVAGRWPGILLTTAVSTAVSVALSEFGESTPESEILRIGVWHAIVFYGLVGLLHGYLWAAYRNIWLNVLLRSGVLLMRVLPLLDLM
ncbi:hypothetical protein GCM10027570_02000 [Streptomonospora sediminis]